MTWPMKYDSQAGVGLVLIQTTLLLRFKKWGTLEQLYGVTTEANFNEGNLRKSAFIWSC